MTRITACGIGTQRTYVRPSSVPPRTLQCITMTSNAGVLLPFSLHDADTVRANMLNNALSFLFVNAQVVLT